MQGHEAKLRGRLDLDNPLILNHILPNSIGSMFAVGTTQWILPVPRFKRQKRRRQIIWPSVALWFLYSGHRGDLAAEAGRTDG